MAKITREIIGKMYNYPRLKMNNKFGCKENTLDTTRWVAMWLEARYPSRGMHRAVVHFKAFDLKLES